MRSSRSKSLAGASALALLALSAGAGAQTKADEYSYFFDGDDLSAETMSTPPPLLRVRPKGHRVLLIRPRVTFVAQLLESVERL